MTFCHRLVLESLNKYFLHFKEYLPSCLKTCQHFSGGTPLTSECCIKLIIALTDAIISPPNSEYSRVMLTSLITVLEELIWFKRKRYLMSISLNTKLFSVIHIKKSISNQRPLQNTVTGMLYFVILSPPGHKVADFFKWQCFLGLKTKGNLEIQVSKVI